MMITVLMVLVTIALMVISEHMARTRGRSVKAWLWVAAITGPLPFSPIALYVLGNRAKPSASQREF
jgi:hypothetical protein